MTTDSPMLIPSPIPHSANSGEKKVYQLLRRQLPSDFVAWYELTLSFQGRSRYPDFIIIGPDQGIIAVEVKGWVLDDISQVKRTLFILRGRQRELREHDPFKQARECVLLAKDILEATDDPSIVHQSDPHRGKLRFPYRHAVALTNLDRAAGARVNGLDRILDNSPVLLKDDLNEGFVERLFSIPLSFKKPMSRSQIDTIRGILYPEVRIANKEGRVLSLRQESVIKNHLSEEAEGALGDPSTRLVRGPAGSGKSLVLIKRAMLESASNPNWRILVLTYNRQLALYLRYLADGNDEAGIDQHNLEVIHFHKWCSRALQSIGEWREPVTGRQRRELIREAIGETKVSLNLEEEFIAEEIEWMKQNELVSWEAYKHADRRGRGVGLTEPSRAKVFQVFQRYNELLGNRIDWEDVPLRVLRGMRENLIATGAYEAVFVDEAQDFAPSWFQVVKRLVNPKTNILFLAADSTQQIYQRGFSWKNLGLNVRGRTVVLTERYRNPPAIQQFTYDFIKGDQVLRRQLEEAGEELVEPHIESPADSDSSRITFQRFPNEQEEYQYVVSQVRKLLDEGYQHSDIAIFHRYGWGVREVAQFLKDQGVPVTTTNGEDISFSENKVRVCTLHSSKGLEFRMVFICGLDRINYGLKFAPRSGQAREEWIGNWVVDQKKLLYVGMTRSIERLYLTYHGPLPAFIAELEHTYRVRE